MLSTDEKTSIQARVRKHPNLPTQPGTSMRVEHEYHRGGAWAYLAALDVHRAKVFGRCERRSGIAPFGRLVPVHGPVHASWLNQIEIYFSIVQRKALTPNDFSPLAAVEERPLAFQAHYEAIAQPFKWKFTRRDLAALLKKIRSPSDPRAQLAA